MRVAVASSLGGVSKVCRGAGEGTSHSRPSAPSQVAPALREKHGYPEMTPALRAKVFGLNALPLYPVPKEVLDKHLAKDRVARDREEARERPDPTFLTHGPKTRREFMNLLAWSGA